MVALEDVSLEHLVVHYVGNQVQDQPLTLSEEPLVLEDDTVKDLLLRYFLSSFKSDAFYHFYADEETALEEHELFVAAKSIFENPELNFYEASTKIAERLYRQAEHPNIKGGEMYVTYFSHCVIDGQIADAVGIFKSENKDTFLKVYQQTNRFDIGYDAGIDIRKLDKGCLIINSEEEMGYKIGIVDKINRNEEALYWKQHFLRLRPREDSYFHTQNYMQLCKNFVSDVFNEEHNVDKAEQIEMLNRSSNYFEKRESFDQPSFEEEVIQEPAVADAFREYKEAYVEERDVPFIAEEFDISTPAFKKNKKIFKSILKLDKNFSVYIHGNRDFIEKGYDEERELPYYKLYYREEK